MCSALVPIQKTNRQFVIRQTVNMHMVLEGKNKICAFVLKVIRLYGFFWNFADKLCVFPGGTSITINQNLTLHRALKSLQFCQKSDFVLTLELRQ